MPDHTKARERYTASGAEKYKPHGREEKRPKEDKKKMEKKMEKKGFVALPGFRSVLLDMQKRGIKLGADLSPGSEAREELPKKEFAGPGRSYPIPDAAHRAAAAGFCAMHHGANSPKCQAIHSKIEAAKSKEAAAPVFHRPGASEGPTPAWLTPFSVLGSGLGAVGSGLSHLVTPETVAPLGAGLAHGREALGNTANSIGTAVQEAGPGIGYALVGKLIRDVLWKAAPYAAGAAGLGGLGLAAGYGIHRLRSNQRDKKTEKEAADRESLLRLLQTFSLSPPKIADGQLPMSMPQGAGQPGQAQVQAQAGHMPSLPSPPGLLQAAVPPKPAKPAAPVQVGQVTSAPGQPPAGQAPSPAAVARGLMQTANQRK